MPLELVSDNNFKQIQEFAQLDSRGRITLGSNFSSKNYRVLMNEFGEILLIPVVTIPENEMWLWKNPKALESLQKGKEQAASGDLHDLGSFAEFADLEIED